MALEPITRQEKIIAGHDLTPITRMEKFLKQYGGGSGGVTSWNDLTDKPFVETTTVKEVLAECQPNVDCNTGQILIKEDFLVEVGQKYILTLNGVDHIATAFDTAGLEGFEGADVLLSNGESLEDANATFFVIHVRDGETYHGTMVVPEGFTVKSISIRQEVTEVKQISGKFVEGMGYVEKVYVLPECQPDFDETIDDGVNIFSIVSPFVAVDGERYIVTFNGEDYECVGIAETDNNPAGLGNMSLFAPLVPVFEDSGEPFWIAFLPNNLMLVNTKCDTPSISIRQETIHPIDQKFLPKIDSGDSGGNSDSNIFVSVATWDDSVSGFVVDKEPSEFIAAYKAGKRMYLNYDSGWLVPLTGVRNVDHNGDPNQYSVFAFTLMYAFGDVPYVVCFDIHGDGRVNQVFDSEIATK